MTRERAEQFLPLLKLQPGIITNNRLGGGFPGDSETPEQFVPPTGFPGRDWETCMTMNDTWGFKSNDHNWKSLETLIRNLVDIASKGGNYLLNVGPTSEGLIPQPSVERLEAIGRWLKVNGEAIYGTSASPFKRLAWGRCTTKPGKLYLHVFDWPADGRLTIPMSGKVTGACLLAQPDKPLDVAGTGESVVITVPTSPPDPIASVIVASVEGDIRPVQSTLGQAQDGTLHLTADDAEIHGSTARVEGDSERNIGFWTDASDTLSWTAKVTHPGLFRVEVVQACPDDTAGSNYTLSVGGQPVSCDVAATGGWQSYKTVPVGKIKVDRAGSLTVKLIPGKIKGYAFMNLRAVVLKPARL